MSTTTLSAAEKLQNIKDFVAALSISTGADAADMLEALDNITAARTLALLPAARQARIFAYLPMERQAELAAVMHFEHIRNIFSDLPPDEQADLYNMLEPSLAESLLRTLDHEDSGDLLKLASYPEGSAGSVATTDYIALREGMTVSDTLVLLRSEAAEKEAVYVLYVLNAQRQLLGTISLRELVLADPTTKVEDIMRANPVVIEADAPRREAADLVQRYDLLAVPVLNGGNAMIGIITVDDAMDVAEAEDASDLARFGGSTLNASELDLRSSSLGRLFYSRFFWLAILTLFGVLTSNIVAEQEEILSEVIILAAFLAPIIDMGGNTGSQSATLVIRAMALGQIRMRMKDVLFVLKRDLPVAFGLGVSIAVLECALAYVSKGVSVEIMLTVGVSMFTVTIAGSLFGLFLPFAAKKIGTDPATLSAPLITSVMDIVGVLIYFSFAYVFLADLL